MKCVSSACLLLKDPSGHSSPTGRRPQADQSEHGVRRRVSNVKTDDLIVITVVMVTGFLSSYSDPLRPPRGHGPPVEYHDVASQEIVSLTSSDGSGKRLFQTRSWPQRHLSPVARCCWFVRIWQRC